MKFANLDTIEAAKKAIGKLRSEKADITIIEDTCQQIGKQHHYRGSDCAGGRRKHPICVLSL